MLKQVLPSLMFLTGPTCCAFVGHLAHSVSQTKYETDRLCQFYKSCVVAVLCRLAHSRNLVFGEADRMCKVTEKSTITFQKARTLMYFQRIGPLADSFIEWQCLCVDMSPPHVIYFEASHWPSDHMISSRPLIGQPSSPPFHTKLVSSFIV